MKNNIPHIFENKTVEIFRRRAILHAQKTAPSPCPTALRPNNGSDFLLVKAAESLRERLALVSRSFAAATDIYSHTDLAADILRESGKVKTIERVESLPHLASSRYPCRICPAEKLLLPQGQSDLITSLLSLHNFNDIPGLLIRICRALKPDGLFLGAMAGAGTLSELRESLFLAESEIYGGITPHIAPFIDIREAGSLLQRAGFALPVTDSEIIIARYDDIFALMRDLRAFGAQNALFERRRTPFSRRFFLRAGEIYRERFSDADGRIRATFSFIWLSGWAPHPDQQQPLRPGSAQMPLAKMLGNLTVKN